MAEIAVEEETLTRTSKEEAHTIQAAARYPGLLRGPWARADGVIQHYIRPGTELITTTLRHDALSRAHFSELGRFRLQQFLLCGWYNPLAPRLAHVDGDPAMQHLPGGTLHTVVGTQDGRVLAYACMQPAGTGGASGCRGPRQRRRAWSEHMLAQRTLGAQRRSWFPSETELFGPEVFPALPALRALPLEAVRELTCLLRNRAIQPAVGVAALLEAVYSKLRLVAQPRSTVRALIGNIDLEARRVLRDLGLPVLYAPEARVAPQRLDQYWSDEVNIQGRFWPFALAQADLRAHPGLLGGLNQVLAQPDAGAWRNALLRLRKASVPILPTAFVPKEETALRWTADPFYGLAKGERAQPHREPAPAEVRRSGE